MAQAQNMPMLIAVRAVILLLCCSGITATAQPLPLDAKVGEKYCRLTESIVQASPDTQIAALQWFLRSHPTFERVYLKLLERYQVRYRVREAKTYFQTLATNPAHQRNSLWMLAKIAMMENETRPAFEHFSGALRIAPPSPALLRDFIEFDMQSAQVFKKFALLQAFELSRENQKIVAALYNYLRLNFAAACQRFREIPAEISHDAVLLHIWGNSFYRLRHYQAADSLWHLGLTLARRYNDPESQALLLTNLGVVANAAQRPDLASSYYDSAYALATRTDDLYNRQRILGFRSNMSYTRSEYNESINPAEEAGQIAVIIGAYDNASGWFLNAGQALYELGRYNEALQAYDKSENYARRVNNKDRLIHLKLKKAAIYSYLSLNEVAGSILQEAYRLAEQQKQVELSFRAQVLLADLMVEEGKYIEARARYEKFIDFLESFPLERHNIFAKIADTYRTEGNYTDAKRYYEQARASARAIGSKAFEAWYSLEMASIDISRGNLSEAIQQFNRVLETATAENIPDMLVRVYIDLGDAHLKTGDLNKAIASYSRAANIIESTRTDLSVDALRIGYFSEKSQVYRKLAEAFFRRHEVSGSRADLDSLFYYAQMTQGRALYDLRLRKRLPSSASANDLVYREYLQACETLQVLQRKLRDDPTFASTEWRDRLEAARYSVVAQRLRLMEQYGASQDTLPAALPLAVVQNFLKQADHGLLLYQISEEASYVVVVTGDDARVERLQTNSDTLAAMVNSLIAPFHEASAESLQDTPYRAALAYRLYKLLINPAEQRLNLPKRLLIVPDLALMNLPFEMLLTAPPAQTDYTPTEFPSYADDFLLQRYTLFYSPTIWLLQEKPRRLVKDPRVLVFANPFKTDGLALNQINFRSGWRFDPLPFTQVEAEGIRRVYPRAKIFMHATATDDTLQQLAPEQEVLHIASHAYVDTTFDAFSGLVLAVGQDSTDDGMLMGYEIADLQLHADLVALSACKTGLGELMAGEGVLGLPRLFLGAGAKSVLMALWQVHDQFASELMPEFYEYFLQRRLSKADALAAAKRALLKDQTNQNGVYYQHPFYWATFTLYGDPGMSRNSLPTTNLASFIVAFLILASLGAGIFYRYSRRRKPIQKSVPFEKTA